MDVSGEQRIPASREQVWKALNNPNVLRKCIPGCETMARKSPTEMTATVKVKVGIISASFKGDVTLTNIVPLESYTMVTEGSGGIAGFAKGSTDVMLREEGGDTVINYTIKAQIGGKLALLGKSLIDKSSRKLATQFFERLAKIIAAKTAASAAPSEA